MSIIQLSKSLSAGYSTRNSTSSQATVKTDAISISLNESSARIKGQLDLATASLSALGKFKSSVSVLQSAGQALSQFSTTSSNDDVKKALGSFIAGFNSMVSATKTVVTESSGVDRISRGMTRSMSADLSRISELRNIGFTRASDGTLKLDPTKFETAYKASPSAVQGTLSRLGKLVDKSASKELASDGRIGNSMDSLSSRSSALKLQQSALLKASKQYANLMDTG